MAHIAYLWKMSHFVQKNGKVLYYNERGYVTLSMFKIFWMVKCKMLTTQNTRKIDAIIQ